MANPNNPFGFKPVSRMGGSPWSLTQYAKAAADANYAIFMNDIVYKSATSAADPTGATPVLVAGCRSAQNGTPGTTLWLGPSLNYGAISTLTMHYVADQPDLITVVQVDATTSVVSATHAGYNANLLATGGSTTTKQSAMTLDHTTLATTATFDFKILAVSTQIPNVEGVYAIVEVLCNKHQYGAQGTVGI